ncbi:MAG TPA: hypothetical protein VN193_11485 [Candidatus Angelobacter sp.]|jgi:hypothetical protein|nr:hypothetical protein [Candidatus Angelobacter sp.]
MALKNSLLSRRKLVTSIAAGAMAIGLGFGSYAIAHSASSGNVSAAGTTGTAASASAATPVSGTVVPFQQGQPGSSKVVGQVPAGFTPGSGTIVTGTAADRAKAAALAAFPGGTVNRVVLLSNGEYNVHVIGVNWPHHIFVNQSFTVVGAE